MKPQVDKSIYTNKGYLSPDRFASYGCQLREILSLRPNSVLEIGIGIGVVAYVLRKTGVQLSTLDFDPSLKPDIIGSVTNIPIKDGSFDVVACFEVLEHIPYSYFPKALSEIARVSKKFAVISIPDAERVFVMQIPKIIRKKICRRPFQNLMHHEFDGEHFWEINKKGYPLNKIAEDIYCAGFCIKNTFRLFENIYHRFFILSKQSENHID